MQKPKIWAHRGASAYAPENTMEAFRLAIQQQADGIELDVHQTKDNYLVVTHDETLERVSNGCGFIKDKTLRELKELNFNCNSPKYERCSIPTLKEVLELIKPTSMEVNIELKTGVMFYEGIEEKVLDEVYDMGINDRVIYSSFNHYSIKKLRELDPSANLGILYSDGWIDVQEYAKKLGVNALHPALYNVQYPNFFEKCFMDNLEINVWTVNTKEYLQMIANTGVNAIITDCPKFAKSVLESDI